MGLVNTRIKSTPCHVYNDIYCCIFYVVGLVFCCRSWTSCLDTWHHGFYQIPTDKNQKSLRNRILDHFWIIQQNNNPNTNLKNNTKMGYLAQNQASVMAIPVLWPEPCRKWVRWTEEKKHRHGAVNLKDLEIFWMKEWSLISCQVFSNLTRLYMRTFWAVKLANGGFKKYRIKGYRQCRINGLTMQIYFYSLLWSYLSRVPTILFVRVCVCVCSILILV